MPSLQKNRRSTQAPSQNGCVTTASRRSGVLPSKPGLKIKREREIERELYKHVQRRGGMALKFTSSVAGVPDRAIILGGDVFFVELKSSVGVLSKLQVAMIRKMRSAGAEVHVIRYIKQIREIIP